MTRRLARRAVEHRRLAVAFRDHLRHGSLLEQQAEGGRGRVLGGRGAVLRPCRPRRPSPRPRAGIVRRPASAPTVARPSPPPPPPPPSMKSTRGRQRQSLHEDLSRLLSRRSVTSTPAAASIQQRGARLSCHHFGQLLNRVDGQGKGQLWTGKACASKTGAAGKAGALCRMMEVGARGPAPGELSAPASNAQAGWRCLSERHRSPTCVVVIMLR